MTRKAQPENNDATSPASLLILTPQGQETHYVLNLSEIILGRDIHSTIQLAGEGVSRRHARIQLATDAATVQDLESTNGTFLNGEPLGTDEHPLQHGDCVRISQFEIRYIDPAAAHDKPPERNEQFATRMATVLAEGTLYTLAAESPAVLDTPEAEAGLLRVVVSQPEGARLVVREGGSTRELALGPEEIVVGRSQECAVRLGAPEASARHAAISETAEGYLLRDLESRQGLRVNGVVVQTHRLLEGDLIRIGQATLVFKDAAEATRPAAHRRPVVIVPGFAASELWRGNLRIWPNLRRLLASSATALERDWQDLRVGQMVRDVTVIPGVVKVDAFGLLVHSLTDDLGYRHEKDLLEFPYDWRRDNKDTARELADTIHLWRKSRERPTEKVTIIAHSMGGLATRLYLSHYGGADAVERCIYLGTPHVGSLQTLQTMIAGGGFLPFGIALRKIRPLVLRLPSFYQLLPTRDGAELETREPFLPLESDPDWLAAERRPYLEAAIEFHRLLHGPPAPVPSTCVFGYEQKTLEKLRLRRERNGRLEIVDQTHSRRGDGLVLETSAVLEDADIHPVKQQHGVLYSDPDVLRRLRFELTERGAA